MKQTKLINRIEFIDLAKGLCILLVVSYHIDQKHYFYANEQVSNFFFAFRMPLYFILSGIFLSINNGYTEFIQKKINRLLVPFIFFIILTNICYYIKHLIIHTPYQYISPLFFLFTENSYGLNNNPLWFLASLFTTYMMFAFMHYLFKGELYKICIASLFCGLIGYMLWISKISIPFYLDTSLTCTPFICAGIIIRKKTNILTCNEGGNNRFYNLVASLICFLITYLSCGGESLFYKNEYQDNYFFVLLAGISGSIGVLLLCKMIVKLPIISFIGRYSIIVLGMHTIIINEMKYFFLYKFTQPIYWEIITFIVVIIISCCLIRFFIKYLPFFVAQQDLVQFIFPPKR